MAEVCRPPQFIPVKHSDYNSMLYVLLFIFHFIYLSFCRRVNHRAHELKISFHHEAPAYLDPTIMNIDIRNLGVVVSILLQPTEIDDAAMLVALLVMLVF
jgi:hypothetical protein